MKRESGLCPRDAVSTPRAQAFSPWSRVGAAEACPSFDVALVEAPSLASDAMRVALEAAGSRLVEVFPSLDGLRNGPPKWAPQFWLVDPALGRGDGFPAVRWIRQHCPEAGVIALSSSALDSLVNATMRAGAHGFFCRTARHQGLLDMMAWIAQGWRCIGQADGSVIRETAC